MKKVLVRAPNLPHEIILSFPFMHQLKKEFSSDQINVVVNEELVDLYRLLHFDFNLYPFPKMKESLIGIHHFCVNLTDVFNIDVFFDLENTLKSVFMGVAFRCHERVGVARGLGKILLTHKIPLTINQSADRYMLNILEKYAQSDFSTVKVIGKEEAPLEDNQDPYIVVALDELPIVEEKMKQFFDSFEDQLFFFWIKDEGDLDYFSNQEKLSNFIASLDKKNRFEVVTRGKNYRQMAQLFLSSKGVFTDSLWKACLASYYGVDSFVFNGATLSQAQIQNLNIGNNSLFLKHFIKSPVMVKMDDFNEVEVLHGDEIKKMNLSNLIDHIHKSLVL